MNTHYKSNRHNPTRMQTARIIASGTESEHKTFNIASGKPVERRSRTLHNKGVPIILREKVRKDICWVPGCKNKGESFVVLSYEYLESDVVLCEKHGEEAMEAGQ